MNKILDKIKKHQKKEYILFGSIPLFLKDKLTNEIDIDELIVSIHNTLPKPPADLIKSIIVLDSPIFAKDASSPQEFPARNQYPCLEAVQGAIPQASCIYSALKPDLIQQL